MRLLSECHDNDFVWAIVQLAQKTNYDSKDPVYWQDDLSENFYFIFTGRVKLTAQNGYKFAQYGPGDILGDSDALLGLPRDAKAIAQVPSVLYMLKMEDCHQLFKQFPHMKLQMVADAEHKRKKHAKRIKAILRKFPEFSLSTLKRALEPEQ